MSVIHVNKENYDAVLKNNPHPLLLDFYATWCGPCQMLAPVLEEIAAERPDVDVVKVDVDEFPELAQECRIGSIPTLLFIKDGEIRSKLIGARPKEYILAMFE